MAKACFLLYCFHSWRNFAGFLIILVERVAWASACAVLGLARTNLAQAEQAAEKLNILSFRAKRGISLRFNCKKTKKERFLASLGMTK